MIHTRDYVFVFQSTKEKKNTCRTHVLITREESATADDLDLILWGWPGGREGRGMFFDTNTGILDNKSLTLHTLYYGHRRQKCVTIID